MRSAPRPIIHRPSLQIVSAPPAPSPAPAPQAAPAGLHEEGFRRALGLEPGAPLPTPPELDGEEVSAASLVRLHYLAHRPDPAAFPRVALRLITLLLDEDVEVSTLCRELDLDAAVAAAVLRRANAAAYRALDPVETTPHAVTRLGLAEVSRVAAGASMLALYDEAQRASHACFQPLWTSLFRHAVVTGRLAAELCRSRRPPGLTAEVAYAAGLLHDLGQLVSLRSLAALTVDGTLPQRDPASARRIVGRVHRELGVEAARAFRLPHRLLDAVAHHHEPPRPGADDAELVQLVRLASALDLLAEGSEAAPAAMGEAIEAAQALGGTPAWLVTAVVLRQEASAWASRAFGLT